MFNPCDFWECPGAQCSTNFNEKVNLIGQTSKKSQKERGRVRVRSHDSEETKLGFPSMVARNLIIIGWHFYGI